MSRSDSARITARRIRFPILAALAIAALAVVAGILGNSLATASAVSTPPDLRAVAPTEVEPGSQPVPPPPGGHSDDSRTVLTEDGGVGDGATVFDDRLPAVANLDVELRDALRRAATDAAADGITFGVNSGWRSARYQDLLLREAIAQYGSADEAARWVATPAASPHVRGEAVDMAQDAAAWLSTDGQAYGLCQIYANEPWHFELRGDAVERGCPAMYADPTHDPRMG